MKNVLLLSLLFATGSSLCAQTDIIKNGGFEDSTSAYTVSFNGANSLLRIKGFFENKTEITNPTIDNAKNVENGIWYKKAANTGYIAALVTDREKASGNYSVNLRTNANMGQNNPKWYQCVLVQPISLEKGVYRLTFKARKEDNANNALKELVANITDKESNLNYTITIPLKENNEWNEYSVMFNLPNFVKRQSAKPENENKTFDYNESILGIAIVPEVQDGKTLLNSVFIDDITLIKSDKAK